MARERALVRLAERRDNDTLVQRAIAAGLNVDQRKVDVSVARPFEVTIYGGLVSPELWEDMPDAEVEELDG